MFIKIVEPDGHVSGAQEVTAFDWVKWQANGCMVLAGSREKAEGIAVPIDKTYLWNGYHPVGINLPTAEEITEIEYREIAGEFEPENFTEEKLQDFEPENALTRQELTEMVWAQAEAIARLTEQIQELKNQ